MAKIQVTRFVSRGNGVGVLVALLWGLLFLAACGGGANTAMLSPLSPLGPNETAFPPMKIRVGVEIPLAPFVVVDANKKEVTGFDVELMKAIAAKVNLDVEFSKVAKDQILTAILNCDYDAGISAISITDELKTQMAFSEPYLMVGQVLVVKKGNITITGRDQLAGMTVGTQASAPSAAEVQHISGAQAELYPTFDVAFQNLIAGYIDAVIADKRDALSFTGIPANNLKVVGEEFAPESYGIAVCKQNTDLLKRINEGLAAVKAEGTLNKLTEKWLKDLVAF
jgi:polar amino acid transport system substrate-binding protein